MMNFEGALRKWLADNGFNCDVCFEDNFGYDWGDNVLHVGVLNHANVGVWFEQFLYEYSLEYTDIFAPVLALLHELGHYSTIFQYTVDDRLFFYSVKTLLDNRMVDQNAMFAYWEIPDEFSANMWEVDFINSNIDVVSELCQIYIDYWNDFINNFMRGKRNAA